MRMPIRLHLNTFIRLTAFKKCFLSHTTAQTNLNIIECDETILNKNEIQNTDQASLSFNAAACSGLKENISFKFDELILGKTSSSSNAGKFSCKLFKLERHGIFKHKKLEIFHEHIIDKSNRQNTNVSFELYKQRLSFSRPTLYEYITLKEQQAVSSHYSIISLVPMLLEINKNSRILECGTGSGSMTLFLSERLGGDGVLHSFDITVNKCEGAKEYFRNWKASYDLRASDNEKWPSNVKFGVLDLCGQNVLAEFSQFYDAIYLDMANLDKAISNAYNLLKHDGVLVVNALHITQIIKLLNAVRELNLGLKQELIMEPNNRLWDIRKILENNKVSGQTEKGSDPLNWTCRLEDRFDEKFKRGGLFFNYWSGFLIKFRKIK